MLLGRYEVAHRLVGNFPQAFSHISLINTAHNLSHLRKPAEQRASAFAQAAVMRPRAASQQGASS